MTDTTYDVHIFKTEKRMARKASGEQYVSGYRVRWRLNNEIFRETFKTAGLAESFRSELLSAARRGEAFRLTDGLPVSKSRKTKELPWLTFARSYMDYKWDESAPGHRRNMAEALTTVTMALFDSQRGQPDDDTLRRALTRTLNPNTREAKHSDDVASAIRWLERSSRPVADIAQPKVLSAVMSALGRTIDGGQAAPSTFRRKRMTLTNALDYAVLSELLDANPLPAIKPKTARRGRPIRQVDKRSVANPIQARTLLNALRDSGPSGQRLVAFFGCLYYAALRPEEALWLGKPHLALPESGWGELNLEHAVPEVAADWTNSRSRNERRELKHRFPGEGRSVPCPPELTELLHWHLEQFGTAPDGRLFVGSRNGDRVGSTVYGRAWANARAVVFTKEVSSLAASEAAV